MEQNELKKTFEAFEKHYEKIIDMIAFLGKIADNDNFDEYGQYTYIITDQLKIECRQLEEISFELKTKCLD